jgi:hypothetical protein
MPTTRQSRSPTHSKGRRRRAATFDVTKNPDDLYVFRVASLRNAAMTPPYFHDGSVATLPESWKPQNCWGLVCPCGRLDRSDPEGRRRYLGALLGVGKVFSF